MNFLKFSKSHSLFTLLIFLFCVACTKNETDLIIGVTAGPHKDIMEEVAQNAEKKNFHIKIVEFNDFIIPNEALNNNDIDLNSFQHSPFLNEQIKSRKYQLVSIGKTILLPIRVYSKKYDSITDIKGNVTIAIPNDPTNRARALKILESIHIISLKQKKIPDMTDVISIKDTIQIKEVDAPLLPRILDDVDFIVCNTDWMLISGQNTENFLHQEEIKDNPYTNILVIHKNCSKKEKIQKFLKFYYDSKVKEFIQKKFNNNIIVNFDHK